ncbi:MAG: aminotransferase class I/II-fold pyridoxal phosphate-dependent enzyme [Solirubrobacteraceae bacterium]
MTYASSFSKTVAPGIRVGYLIGPPELVAEIDRLATGAYISPNMVAQGIVNQVARCGAIEQSIQSVRAALSERLDVLAAALERELPQARFVKPQGGYFMWVELPRGTDVAALLEAARARGVQFVKGSDFVLEGHESSLRLAYSGVSSAQIDEGIGRLAAAYRELGASVAA